MSGAMIQFIRATSADAYEQVGIDTHASIVARFEWLRWEGSHHSLQGS